MPFVWQPLFHVGDRVTFEGIQPPKVAEQFHGKTGRVTWDMRDGNYEVEVDGKRLTFAEGVLRLEKRIAGLSFTYTPRPR